MASVVGDIDILEFAYNAKPIVLRGTGQVLAVNLNGVTVTGGTFTVAIEWYEI